MVLPLHKLSRGTAKKAGHEQGFTLIELVVVTFLIGLMLSISIPSLRNAFFTDPLRASTRKVIGLVTGVRELAARSQQPYLLHINRNENRIWYEREKNTEENHAQEAVAEKELTFPEAVKIAGVWVGSDDTSSQGQIVIWISKQGYLQEMIVRLEDDDGNHLNVQFYPFLEPALVSDDVAPL